ncbi:hypothetical protein SASPL_117571 [Salvia splendens]|uniref:Senescence domain-containing protein n=1 Tax=Salvia splendens TaxID=180675 RepID=A0A8X8ZWF0_SALSN|nr:hypothetical protein SASPL_117571 [Salvia splendens]
MELSKMTEKMSKGVLNVAESGSGSAMAPILKSQSGEGLLVYDARRDKITEAAEKQSMVATSGAVKTTVTNKFGEATETVLATVGSCVGTAWNVFKIRQAINPAGSASSTRVLKIAATKSIMK